MTLESELEEAFRLRVRRRGGLVVQLAPTTAGVPDRMVLHSGRIFLVELKTDVGILSPIQRAWHRKAAACGVIVVVLRGRDAVLRWADEL